MKKDSQRVTSSDSCESLNNDLKNKKTKPKRFRNAATGSSNDSLLKGGEKNETKKIKSKRKSGKWAKGSRESDNEEESTGSESRNAKKKAKVAKSSSGSESDNEESSSFENKKSRVLEKLRGIWKLTESSSEVGLHSSQERLKRLSDPESFPTIESLQKEFKKLELLMTLINCSVNTVRNSVDSLAGDFTFENVKDETVIFRSQETKIKAIMKKLLQDSDDEKVGKESSKAEDDVADGDSSKEEEEKRKKEKKRRSSIGGGENNESGKEDAEESESDKNSGDIVESDSKSLGKSETEVNNSEQVKPMIKVKSFAKMLGDNVLENTVVDVEEVEEVTVEDSEKKPNQAEEYHMDIDTDKEGDENVKKKKKEKNKKTSESSSENEEYKIISKRNKKKENNKMKASFEKFKEKREKFLKEKEKQERDMKLKEEKEKKLKEKKEKKEEEEKDKKKSEAEEEEKKKEVEVMNTDSDSDEKQVKRSGRRKRIIASSDEEENGEKADKENEEKSGGSDKEKEENDSDFQIQSPKISSGETSSDEETRKQSKYKRIRKKKKRGSSSERSDDDDDDDGKKKKGRKNIKKILKKDSLHVETKEALKNEEERRKRLEERQKLFYELFPEDEESKRLIFDFDPETKEPLISVHKKLVKKLKPHQMKGVKFMWDNCFESVQRLEEDTGSGCILAHCMGLGKTLQVVTLVHTVMTHDLGVNTVLIVCPLSTVKNWINEFEMWLQNIHTEPITLYELVKYKKQEDRCFHLKDWQENGGVLVVSYDLFRTLTSALLKPTKSKAKTRKKAGKVFEMAFHDPGPDLVICDEGHLLKNEDTALSKCMSLIKTSRRIVLTGTPLQNNLLEYHCMVQFVKPNILGTKKEFMNRFVNPINNGQFEDSTEFDVKIMKRRSHVLHSMLKGCVQRFDYSVLTPFLPEKHEYVLTISLTETQATAYRHFIASLSGKASGGTRSTTLFNDYHHLQRIWTHPRAMLLHSEKVTRDDVDSEGSLKDFVVDSDESTEESSSSEVEEVAPTKKRILRSNANDPEVKKAIEEEEKEAVKNWWDDYFKESDYDDIRASNKLVILFSLLKYCGERKDKVLVFSQSLYSLDLIEYFLGKIDECSDRDESNEFLCGHKDSWVQGADYFRLDGSTSSENRSIWCKHFNHESNTRARLFLISTRAGGLGINLYGANRVVIFDASWNPSHDLQSIFRVYRFGQKKPCFIYRFLAEATMEEKIYKRQVTKLSLAHRVVDEHQIERHYSMMNLSELYDYDPTPKESRKLPKLPKDKVFADLLSDFKEEIVSYHEHDSLLENQEEEELSEEERKAAWKEYEDEKVIKAASFNQLLYQQHLQAMVQAQAQGIVPEIIDIGDDGPARIVNPAFLSLAQGNAGQSFVNPMYMQSSIPSNILLRGSQLGVTPLFNESTESFFNRVKMRERWMQGPRET